MPQFISVIKIVFPVFLALVLGYLCKRRRIISPEGIEGLKKLSMSFALPATLFGVFFSADYSTDILICAVTMFVMMVLGLLAGKGLCRLTGYSRPVLGYMTSGCEIGMLGYSFYILLFGSENLQNMAMIDLGQVTFCFTCYVTTLTGRSQGGFLPMVKNTFKTPIIWAIIAGALFGATGVSALLSPSGISDIVTATTDFISAPLSCVILFVVGYGIELKREMLRPALLSVVVRYVCCAVLCFLTIAVIGLLMPVTELLRWAIVMVFILPAPYILPLYLKDKTEQSYASVCLSMQTLFSIAAFAVIAFIAA